MSVSAAAAAAAGAGGAASAASSSTSPQSRLEDLTVRKAREMALRYLLNEESVTLTNPDFTRASALRAMQGGVWYSPRYRQARLEIFPTLNPSQADLVSQVHYPRNVSDGHAPEEYFTKIDDLLWRVKPDVSASDALDAALKGPTLTDCGGFCNLARAYALREVLGKERFDNVFKGRLIIGYPPYDYIDYFFKPSTDRKIHKGAMATFKNCELYFSKHPFGYSPGWHMIARGDGTFVGLGGPHGGLSADQVTQFLVAEFNKPIDRRLGGVVTEEEFQKLIAKSPARSEDRLLQYDLQIDAAAVPGLDTSMLSEFNMSRINALLERDPGEITERALSRIFPEWRGVTQRLPDFNGGD